MSLDSRPPADSGSATASRELREPWYRRRGARWLVAALTFVVGLFVGGVIVGFVSAPSEPSLPRATVTVSPPVPSASPASSSDGVVTGQAAVNGACLRAINDAQSAYTAIGQLISAVRSVDFGAVDSVIRKLEAMQSELRSEFRACRVTTRLGGTAAASPSPSH